MSMGIVGVKSTAGREVKFIDPSKTTKSESTWLGYPLCVSFFYILAFYFLHTHIHTLYIFIYIKKIIPYTYTLQ